MASLFKMTGKPFWYLRHKVGGKWKKTSTGLRHDDPRHTAEAQALRADAEAKELRESPAAVRDHGWDWVGRFIQESGLSELTIQRYNAAWRWVSTFLLDRRLSVTGVRYTHVAEYMEWRVGRRRKHGKAGGRNTAILEVKLLAYILTEAVRRGYIVANPLASLKLRRTEPERKRIFTDEEIARCRAGLATCPDWMKVAFEISLCTGCRLRETRIPLDCIDLDAAIPTITFPAPKGGRSRAFSVPVPSQLLPLLRRLREEGRTHTIDTFPFQPSRRWQQFFEVQKIEGVSFHCLRATKVTLMRREGVPREAAMRLVNHSSELIHQLYDRHRVQDLAQWADSGIAGSGDARSQNPTNKSDLQPVEDRSKNSEPPRS